MQPVRGEVAPADDGLLSTAGSAAEADANTAESGERFADKSAGVYQEVLQTQMECGDAHICSESVRMM